VIAKSVNPARIKENKESLIALDAEDMKILNSYSNELQKTGKLMRYVYPAFGVDFGFPDKS
jgi:diketogulonate reductase-like aldo/keto reductase